MLNMLANNATVVTWDQSANVTVYTIIVKFLFFGIGNIFKLLFRCSIKNFIYLKEICVCMGFTALLSEEILYGTIW